MKNTLYIVVPCYNEEAVLRETASRLKAKMRALIEQKVISAASRVLFVNDGSRDMTWQIISELHSQDSLFSGVDLTRNCGHQKALIAGLMTARENADIVISMDADLQDDIEAVDKMISKYTEGCDIVYGVRSSRKKDTFFKRITAEAFYKFMSWMGVDIIFNHADYRLMSKQALDSFAEFKEVNLFLRGLVPLLGYKTAIIEYERGERFAGESKYPLGKMISFAVEGITSFSTCPLRFISYLGLGIFLVSMLMLCYAVVQWISEATVTGWTSLICSVWAIGGLILLAIGILGEYIGKIYLETKSRPRYLIRTVLDHHES